MAQPVDADGANTCIGGKAATKPPAKGAAHQLANKRVTVLAWGEGALIAKLPPPDSLLYFELHNSSPEISNAIRRAAMNAVPTYALSQHIKITCSDRYIIKDQIRRTVPLIRLYQVGWTPRSTLKLKVTNSTADILVVTSDDFRRTDGSSLPACVGCTRITTLAQGHTLELECEVQLATAAVGAGHRATGSFHAYGLDYQNVGTVNAEGKPGDRWVSSLELRALIGVDISPLETPVLVVRGADYRKVTGSATRYFTVPALPAAQSSTNAADRNFALQFRLEACWDPETFLGIVLGRLVLAFEEMRNMYAQGSIYSIEEQPGVTQYIFEEFDKCHGDVLRRMIAEMDSSIFTNFTWIHQHTEGFKLRIAHPDSSRLLLAALERGVATFSALRAAA